MKIPLVGESSALRSPAASVQQTLNLIPQFIDDPNEQAKNRGILIGCPGYHLMGNFDSLGGGSNDVITALWSCGGIAPGQTQAGRLFALADNGVGIGKVTTIQEFFLNNYVGGNPSTGGIGLVGSSKFTLTGAAADGNPGYLMGNGNQLGIVKNGYFWIDQGAGPTRARFLISGTVNTASAGGGTSTCTWVSGDQFPTAMVAGTYITINGTNYLITTYTDSTHLVLTEDAGSQSGATFRAPAGDYVTAVSGAFLDGYFIVQRPVGQYTISGTASSSSSTINWVSGDFFDNLVVGQTITFNLASWVVDTIVSPQQITVTGSVGTHTTAFSALVGADLGRQINCSYVDDGTSWDPLDFASKEGNPDYLQSILADHEQLYLFGTETTEIWQDTGNAFFPFQRIPGAMARRGSVARYAPTAMSEKIYFIDGNPLGHPVAYRLDGFTPVRISTHAVEQAWASGIDTPSNAIAYAEIHDGHSCWVVNFLGSLNTWVYDQTASEQAGTPIWHQRGQWNGATFGNYLPRFHTFVREWGNAGMHVVGDWHTGDIHELNLNYFDQNGNDQKWVRILPHLYHEGKLQFFGRMTLEMETGTTTSLVTQPAITRDYSDDRGHTFGNALGPLQGGAGVSLAYSQRVYWPNNGSSRDRVFRLSGTGQYQVTLIDLTIDPLEYETA